MKRDKAQYVCFYGRNYEARLLQYSQVISSDLSITFDSLSTFLPQEINHNSAKIEKVEKET